MKWKATVLSSVMMLIFVSDAAMSQKELKKRFAVLDTERRYIGEKPAGHFEMPVRGGVVVGLESSPIVNRY